VPEPSHPSPADPSGADRASGAADRARFITLVDDDVTLLPAVQAIVDDALPGRWLVHQKTRGLEAVYDFMSRPPDIVILDLGLPDVDGLTVLRLLKSEPRLARIPVVILSANSNWNMLQLALDAGADTYLYKPFKLETLVGTLRDLSRIAASAAPARAPAAAVEPPADDGGRRRLLIIEDHGDTVELLRRLLAHPRVEIATAADGEEGCALAWSLRPDAILLDVMLPRKGGFEAFIELRRARSFEPQIVLMSAHAGPRVFSLARDLGAYACLSKPFDDGARAAVLGALGISEASGPPAGSTAAR
jgi:hypothetical protein